MALHAGENFERELGGGLLFRVTSEKQPGWFFDIVPAEAVSKDYIYPVNLPLRFNPNQTLGPGYGENAKSSLGYAHEMQFLIYKTDYDQVSSLTENVLWPDKVSDPDRAFGDFASAVHRAKKGRLKVTVSSYKTGRNRCAAPHQVASADHDSSGVSICARVLSDANCLSGGFGLFGAVSLHTATALEAGMALVGSFASGRSLTRLKCAGFRDDAT